MPIPTYQQCMLPILQLMADEKIRRRPKITAAMADHFRLTDEERAESLKAGTKVIESRSGWAITYLNKADLIDNATRGNYQITTAGKDLLDTGITKLHNKELLEVSTSFKEWCDYCDQKWRDRKEEISDPNGKRPVSEVANEYSPEETLQNAWSELKIAVIGNIHSKLKECDPALFEKIVVDVLAAMGYGGSHEGAKTVTRYSQDGGIDGILDEDQLGLDSINVQAKRQQSTVGRTDLQAFVGAMQGKGVKKGVFVTTSTFSKSAYEYKETIETRLALIDGERLSELMFTHNIGVSTINSFEYKKVSDDYFEDQVNSL